METHNKVFFRLSAILNGMFAARTRTRVMSSGWYGAALIRAQPVRQTAGSGIGTAGSGTWPLTGLAVFCGLSLYEFDYIRPIGNRFLK